MLQLKKDNPEKRIQKAVEEFLTNRGWYVLRTHGNAVQSGFPDDYCTHKRYGPRWVEIKLPGMKGSQFTAAQLEVFPKLINNGAGVWIITGATEEEYRKLFKKPNYWEYLI